MNSLGSVFMLKCPKARGINMFGGNFALLVGKSAGRIHMGCRALLFKDQTCVNILLNGLKKINVLNCGSKFYIVLGWL